MFFGFEELEKFVLCKCFPVNRPFLRQIESNFEFSLCKLQESRNTHQKASLVSVV